VSGSTAVVVFVKTPGLSRSKTRLAAGVGANKALAFYVHCLGKMNELLKSIESSSCTKPYWAIAEQQGKGSLWWQDHETIVQSEGELGDRLHSIYSQLMEKHDAVIFLGADSPQVELDDVLDAVKKIESNQVDFVMGKTQDGGFYLFAGSKPLDEKVWTDVPYSVETTASELSNKLESIGQVEYIKDYYDVDTIDDLERLSKEHQEYAQFL